MQDAAVDKDDITGSGSEFLFVKGGQKFSLEDTDDFVFHVPVVGHDVLGVRFVYMIKFKGEVVGPPLFGFVKVVILHKNTSEISTWFSLKSEYFYI